MMFDDPKDRAQIHAQGYAIAPGDVFRHYKGGLYVVVCVSVKEDTLEPLITYRSNKKETIWTRTASNFLERVCHSAEYPLREEFVPRFRREED